MTTLTVTLMDMTTMMPKTTQRTGNQFEIKQRIIAAKRILWQELDQMRAHGYLENEDIDVLHLLEKDPDVTSAIKVPVTYRH